MTVHVIDLLDRDYFKSAKVLAGENGLDREVRWVHIVEIARFGHLLNGKEIILTTGLGWANDEKKSLSYLQQLLDYGAAALCVELVFHVQELPEKMLQLADEHDFPIIGFQEEVRFIDITKDIHELIIGHHENVWWRLETLHKKLNEKLTSNGSAGDFLRILHKETNKKVALSYDNQFRFFPSPPKREQYEWIKTLDQTDHKFINQPIKLLEENIGFLYYIEDPKKITTYDELALNRCKEILEQFFWKHHTEQETNQMKRNEWIFDAINGKLTNEEVRNYVKHEIANATINEAIIAVMPFENSLLRTDQTSISETALIMLLRPVFIRFGFHLLAVKDDSRNLFVLLLFNKQSDQLFERLEQSIHTLQTNNHDPLVNQYLQLISFGRIISDYRQLGKSYETALTTLHYQQNIEKLAKPFYNHLGVYRLIDRMNNVNDIKEIIEDYLSPLIDYDEKNNTELLHTLEVFLQNHGARNETAEQLNVVRQTLYHRLKRIEALIGEDFMEPNNRLMMEFALYALKYVER